MKKQFIKSESIFHILIIIIGIIIDIITKRLAVLYLKPIGFYDIIPGIIGLSYKENTGAAFSILEGKRLFFIILTSCFMLFLLYILFSGIISDFFSRITISMIISGGIGNLIDRIIQGYVVDMIDFYLINFAVFNFADILVTCGAFLFVFRYIIKKGSIIEWK